jgi:two-component sensor histidine kinase
MIRPANVSVPVPAAAATSSRLAALFATQRGSTGLRIVAVVTACLVVAAISAAQHIVHYSLKNEPGYPGRTFAAEVLEWLLWGSLVPVILRVDARFGFGRRNLAGALAAHGALFLTFLLLHNGLMAEVNIWVDPTMAANGYRQMYLTRFVSRLTTGAAVYASILLIDHGLAMFADYHRRTARGAQLEAQLATARLQNLKMQLQPHFLFNTLHVIAGLVREGNRGMAVDAIAHLSDLLRQALRRDDRQEVTVEEELEFLDAYLEIQRIRFGDRLTVRIDAPAETRDALVPHLLFQPLVENAVRHGIAKRMTRGVVSVRLSRDEARLLLEVSDDGAGFRANAFANGGVGLRNTMARLRQLYGDQHSFEIAPGPQGGTSVRIGVPFRQGERDVD